MKKTLPFLALFSLCLSTANAVIVAVEDWQFNTIGDAEGWTGSFGTQNFNVRNAISGSEIVLSSGSTTNDPQTIHNPDIALPANSTWDSLVFRFRQIDGNPTNVATEPLTPYDPNGTIVLFSGLSSGNNYGAIPVASTGNYTIVQEADEWRTVTVSLGGKTGDIASIRIDPIAIIGDGFEIDYITLYADTAIPEPSTYAALLGLAALAGVIWRRRSNC